MLNYLEDLETNIRRLEDYYLNSKNRDECVGHKIFYGSNKVVLSAPHSVEQFREGKFKLGEFRTGVLVELLLQSTDSFGITKTKCLSDDANYDVCCDYKEDLLCLVNTEDINYLFDFHISSPKRCYDFELGTGYGKNLNGKDSCLNLIVNRLESEGFNVTIDSTFPACYQGTVCSAISSNSNVCCIQVEINWKCIDSTTKLIKIADIFKDIIERLCA